MGNRDVAVASLAEAWIETFVTAASGSILTSPPSRRRGLKHGYSVEIQPCSASPPSRRRGLKRFTQAVSHLQPCRLPRGGVD